MRAGTRSVGWGIVGHLAVPASTGVLVLGLPFFVDPTVYGYWQLYLFYAMWLGYLTFGVPDGHHLRYSGQGLGVLDPRQLAGKTLRLLVGVALACTALAAVGWVVALDPTQRWMWVLACISTVLFVPRTLLTAALQAGSRFGPFSTVMLVERGLVVALTATALVLAGARPGALATADVVAKAAGLALGALVTMRLVHDARTVDVSPPPASSRAAVRADAAAGILVVLANLAAVGVHGVLRLAVERGWGVVEFGQVSLAFSTALLITTAAHALGWLALPTLARAPAYRRPAVHRLARDGARGPLAAVVLLYLPCSALLERWLPDYRSALVYLGLLLPLVVVESRWRVTTVGLLKVMRSQQTLLAFNLGALAAATALALWFSLVTPSVTGLVLSLLAVSVLRSVAADAWIGRRWGQPWAGGVAADLTVVAGLAAALAVGGWAGAGLGLLVAAGASWWHRGATAQLLVRLRQALA